MKVDQIRRLTVQSRHEGVVETTTALKGLTRSHNDIAPAASRAAKSTLEYQLALDRMRQQSTMVIAEQNRLMREMSAQQQANDNAAHGFHTTGIELAQTANHMKTAAIAAYALSPAFRAMVNPAITASVKATGAAMATMGPVAASAAGAALRGFAPLLGIMSRIALPITLGVEAFKAMNAVTELGAQRLIELDRIASNAGAAGVTSDFWQRQAKGAEEFKIKADFATQALKRFSDINESQLGGSGFNQHLDALIKVGNFANNEGVAAYRQAVSVEEKYRAAGDIITVAIQQGERLAGLDLASKFLPNEMLEKLRANGEYLREMRVAADNVKPAEIFTQEQIGYAAELNRRLEQANDTIANRLKPIQRDLTTLGLTYQESWVQIAELKARAASGIGAVYGYMKELAAAATTFARSMDDVLMRISSYALPGWLQTMITMATMPARLAARDPAVMPSPTPVAPAQIELRGWLQDATAVQAAMKGMTESSFRVRQDLSKPLGSNGIAAAARETKDALDRAIDAQERYIQVTNAAARSVDAGVFEQQKAKTIAELTAAALRDGKTDLQQYAAEWEAIGNRAGNAARELGLARVNSQIRFDNQTSLLSQEDVAIARQLKDLYPDVAEGLNSVQAAGIRTNNALSGLSSSMSGSLVSGLTDIFSRSKSVGQGFSDMSRVVVRAIQEMIVKLTIVGPLMRALQSGFGAWFGGGAAPTGGTGFTLTGTGGHYAAGGHVRGPGTATSDSILARLSDGEFVVNARATANNLPLLRAINDNAPRYAAGGQIGRPMAPSTAAPQLSIVFNNAPAGTQAGKASISKDAAGNMNLEVWFKSAVEGVVAEDAARNGPISKTMAGRSNRFTGS